MIGQWHVHGHIIIHQDSYGLCNVEVLGIYIIINNEIVFSHGDWVF